MQENYSILRRAGKTLRLTTFIIASLDTLAFLLMLSATFGSLSDAATKGLDNAAGFALIALFLLTAAEFAHPEGVQLVSRWPAIALLVITGVGYLTWMPLSLHMPIGEVGLVYASVWMPTVILIALLGRIALAFVVLAVVKERQEVQQRMFALTDALTGLPNRRALFEAAERAAPLLQFEELRFACDRQLRECRARDDRLRIDAGEDSRERTGNRLRVRDLPRKLREDRALACFRIADLQRVEVSGHPRHR